MKKIQWTEEKVLKGGAKIQCVEPPKEGILWKERETAKKRDVTIRDN